MDRRDSPKRHSSRVLESTALASTSSQISNPAPPVGDGPPGVPTVTEAVVHCIPEEHSSFFTNKIVLGFEEEFIVYKAKSWIRSYNQTSAIKLEFVHELPIALFVVQFNSADVRATKASLLASSPLGFGEIYASVNDYSISLDPCNQEEFRHLVTVNIPKGNPVIFSLIKYLIHVVGKYVKGFLGPDLRHISVIAETNLKLFPAYGQFQLKDAGVTTISFDCVGRNLRCCYYFSYRHFPSSCRQPRPSYFDSPRLKLDAVPKEASGVQVEAEVRGTQPSQPDRHQESRGTVGQLVTGQAEPSGGARKGKSKRGRPRDRTPNFGGTPLPHSVSGGESGVAGVAAGADLVPRAALPNSIPEALAAANGSGSSEFKADTDTIMLFA